MCVLLITVCCLVIGDGGEDEQEAAAEAAEKFLSEDLPENVFGAVKAGSGMWSLCLKIMHTTEGKTLELVQFQQNASACTEVSFVLPTTVS